MARCSKYSTLSACAWSIARRGRGAPEGVEPATLDMKSKSGTPAGLLPPGLEVEHITSTVDLLQLTVPRRFANFRDAIGGRQVLGMAISPVLADRNDEGGAIWVQYFDKARIEYNPILTGTICEVQLSRLWRGCFQEQIWAQPAIM